jgi:predicted nucleic acid-binding protein
VIVADTDVLIDFHHGIAPVREQIARYIDAEELAITVITVFELMSGGDEGKRARATREFAESLTVLPLEFHSTERAAALSRRLARSGRFIPMADCLIAGIALAHDLPLLTRNRRHFSRVPNLKLVDIRKV